MNRRIHAPRPDAVRSPAPAPPRPALARRPAAMGPADLLDLQSAAGNRAARAFAGAQRALQVGAAGDALEVEADHVAKRVLAGEPAPAASRASLEEEEPLQGKHLNRAAEHDDDHDDNDHDDVSLPAAAASDAAEHASREFAEEEELQAKRISRAAEHDDDEHEPAPSPTAAPSATAEHATRNALEGGQGGAPEVGAEGGTASAATTAAIEGARGGGRPLDPATRREMEGHFDADFSQVRIHQGGQADQLNQSLSARAFTTGSDIFVGDGGLNAGSRGGKELLAHELTHVVQQGGARRKPRTG